MNASIDGFKTVDREVDRASDGRKSNKTMSRMKDRRCLGECCIYAWALLHEKDQ